jgi:hypothetical protein
MILVIINGCTLALSSGFIAESDHSYLNDYEHTWIISDPGVSQIQLHFDDLDLAKDDGLFPFSFDKLIILDKDDNELKTYGSYFGVHLKNFSTDWYTGDTLKIKLVTDHSGTAYGFSIDRRDNRTDISIYNNSLPESYHYYANNYQYTWSPITESGAQKIRIHFNELSLKKDDGLLPFSYDKLIILDKYGNELATYGSYFGVHNKNFCTDWYPVDTLILRFVTDNSGTDYGFNIERIDTRVDNITIIGPEVTGSNGVQDKSRENFSFDTPMTPGVTGSNGVKDISRVNSSFNTFPSTINYIFFPIFGDLNFRVFEVHFFEITKSIMENPITILGLAIISVIILYIKNKFS